MTVQEAQARTRIAVACRRAACELGVRSEFGRKCAEWAHQFDAYVATKAELLDEVEEVKRELADVADEFEAWRSTGRASAERSAELERSLSEYAKAKAAWKRISKVDRDRIALELIGDDRLIIRELCYRFGERLPDCNIYEGYVRPIVYRLLAAGELVREPEPRVPGGTAIRYRYHRNTDLSGDIADLDRTFHDEQGEA
jgi:hypothetical protein